MGKTLSKKLLVVDDDLLFRGMLVEILKAQGFDVAEAGDGEEGITTFKAFAPDLVITDIRMPKKTGIQMAQEILRLSPETPIIFVSGWYDPARDYPVNGANVSSLKDTFCVYFLKKPFRIPQLLSLINETNTPCKKHQTA